jgi:hypothetical protein
MVADDDIDVSGLFEVAAPGGSASAGEMVGGKPSLPSYVSRQVLPNEPDPPLLERLHEVKGEVTVRERCQDGAFGKGLSFLKRRIITGVL